MEWLRSTFQHTTCLAGQLSDFGVVCCFICHWSTGSDLQILLGIRPAFPASQVSLLLLFLNVDQDPHGALPNQHVRHNILTISGSAKALEANGRHPAAEGTEEKFLVLRFPSGKRINVTSFWNHLWFKKKQLNQFKSYNFYMSVYRGIKILDVGKRWLLSLYANFIRRDLPTKKRLNFSGSVTHNQPIDFVGWHRKAHRCGNEAICSSFSDDTEIQRLPFCKQQHLNRIKFQ